MNKLEQKRADRKHIILTEAKKLILERGISDGLMSELAVRSGISRQRLYVYYSNIDEVLCDLMESVYAHSHLDKLLQTPYEDPKAVIRYSILAFPTLSDDMHDDLLFLSLYGVYCATNKKGRSRETKHIRLFEKQILDGQQRGIFRTDHSLEHLSTVATHLITGFLYQGETLSPDSRHILLNKEILNLLADMVLNFLAVKA